MKESVGKTKKTMLRLKRGLRNLGRERNQRDVEEDDGDGDGRVNVAEADFDGRHFIRRLLHRR